MLGGDYVLSSDVGHAFYEQAFFKLWTQQKFDEFNDREDVNSLFLSNFVNNIRIKNKSKVYEYYESNKTKNNKDFWRERQRK